MKREIRIKLKQLEKDYNTYLKYNCKYYSLKKKGSHIWKASNTMFFYAITDLWYNEKKNSFCSSVTVYVKPLWTDELLWRVLDMEENLKAPLSLRCDGAFTFFGLKCCYEVLDFEDIETSGTKMLTMISDAADKFNEDYFNAHSSEIDYQRELFDILDLIYKEQFLSAINYSNKINHYYFINKGKSFLEYVIEYCKKNT